jgi:hypothetical protein
MATLKPLNMKSFIVAWNFAMVLLSLCGAIMPVTSVSTAPGYRPGRRGSILSTIKRLLSTPQRPDRL